MTARLLLCAVVPVLVSACVATSTASSFSPRPHREVDLVSGSGEVRHKVEKGQTLYRIAKTYGLTVDELMTANKLDDPRELKIGEELLIPGARKPAPKVVEADSPEPTPPARPASPAPEKRQQRTAVKVGKSNRPSSWPLRGVLYARFGRKGKEPHDGIDLAAPAGTPVKTAAPGTTLYAGEQKGYGLIVIVEH